MRRRSASQRWICSAKYCLNGENESCCTTLGAAAPPRRWGRLPLGKGSGVGGNGLWDCRPHGFLNCGLSTNPDLQERVKVKPGEHGTLV